MKKRKILILLVVLLGLAAFFGFDLGRYFNLAYFQQQRESLLAYTEAHFWQASALFFFMYVAFTALSLPAAALLTLISGALFGFVWGLVLASFASSIGATLAFLASRTLFHDWVQGRFSKAFERINRGMEKDGEFYLFSLRVVPLFPFFLINLVMGLTRISVWRYYIISQAGMVFGTALYVNIGAQLGQATSVRDVLSLNLYLTLIAIALFPWVGRSVVNGIRARKVFAGFERPKHFEANLVVIGAGAAGLVTSLIGSMVKAKVILVEKNQMGGDCLNTGCVPSKAILRSAAVSHQIDHAEHFGIEGIKPEQKQVNFTRVMQRIRDIIARIEPHDSVERYQRMGVECVQGEAAIISPFAVEVNGRQITTRNIVIATGARPVVPEIPGLDDVVSYTSETIWSLRELPQRLLVLGTGPIGCELSQAFSRLGSNVTIAGRAPQLLPREDDDVSALVGKEFVKEGITVLTGHELKEFRQSEEQLAVLVSNGQEVEVGFDAVLLAMGRQPNTEGFGLEKLHIAKTEKGALLVNEYLQTSYPNIYACGDVAGPYQFTHMAAHQAWYASVNSLFGQFRKYAVNYRVVPHATFTDPEVARVGLNEKEATEQNISFEVTLYGLDDLDRAIADSEDHGFVKVLTVPGKDRILGVTIVGHRAGDLISEFVLAMTHRLGLKKIMGTIHIYPTMSEGSKFAAGAWRRKYAPEWLYPWLEKYHRWQRRQNSS